MDVLFLLGLYWLAASLAGASLSPVISDASLVLPFEVIEGESTAEVVSVDGGLDLPKLTPGVNSTTFDWWYFDVVSSTTIESFSIIFANIENPNLGGALAVQVSGTYLDGTTFSKTMPATRNASFVANDRGIASHWDGEAGDFSFSGTNLDAPNITYTISGDDPDTESFGTVTLTSVSPPRYPCDPNIAGATEEIMPDVYSSNAVPDSDATVELIIGGQAFNFEGYGYHDKRWGVNLLDGPVTSYYWGHGRLGPYSIVWLDALSRDGKEYFSSWISMNGTVAFQSCGDKSVVVRPWKKDGTDPGYPPKPRDPAPDGYDIRFDVGEGQAFTARFYTSTIQLSTDVFKRITGPIVGGFEGGEKYEGVALGEQAQN
ncbi:hypothetical protein KVR01_011948 [Diaporthe batatas]|uniref:uncharacterized protein n=1 Tax=Diaporthe batatas TaxID=748121 RepID=UPI001D05A979|nr:uncharacterized protein KVR01_011948 [Diaporthe batatas]KAG8158187.1 hypothetical protein KVR01_011948 [Diaporthe batatas]